MACVLRSLPHASYSHARAAWDALQPVMLLRHPAGAISAAAAVALYHPGGRVAGDAWSAAQGALEAANCAYQGWCRNGGTEERVRCSGRGT